MTTTRSCAAFLIAASVVPAFAAPKPSQNSPSTPEGLLLLHKMQNALGGPQRIAAVRDFEETIRAEAWTKVQ